MPVLSKPSSAAHMAIVYITVGTVVDIWSGVWCWYLRNYPPQTSVPFYWCAGLFLTGLALVVIGLALGRIGRSARHAEMPPPEVTPAEEEATREAAARVPVAMPMNPAFPQGAVAQPMAVPPPPAPVQGVPPTPACPRR